MKVAISTSDGLKVDTHFGKAELFYIYSFQAGKKLLLEKRTVNKYSPIEADVLQGSQEHPFVGPRFNQVYQTISDCQKLYTVAIGDTPKRKLKERGIEVEECMCAIDWIPAKEDGQKSNIKYFLS